VDQCPYLGKTFNQQLRWNQESALRVGRAYGQLNTLRKVGFYLGPAKALQVWRQWFTTAVAYGAEAVVYNNTIRERLNVLDRTAWRICLGVDVGTNKSWFECMLGLSTPYTTTSIDIQKLKWWRQLDEGKHDTISSQMWWITRMLTDVSNKTLPHSTWFSDTCRLLQGIGLGEVANGSQSAAHNYSMGVWNQMVKERLLGQQMQGTMDGLDKSAQRLKIFRETLQRGRNGERWNGEGEFFRWMNIGLSVAETLWWCKFRGGLMVGKGRENNWNSDIKCRKCQLSDETMEHVIYHCRAMDRHRQQLLKDVAAVIDNPLEALEFARLGEVDQEEQMLVTLGKDKKWEVCKEEMFWREVVQNWKVYMKEFLEG
jgi:hypothetical protein